MSRHQPLTDVREGMVIPIRGQCFRVIWVGDRAAICGDIDKLLRAEARDKAAKKLLS